MKPISFPKLTLLDPGSRVAPRLGHPLVDDYSESVHARLRPNSTLAVVYDLKVILTVGERGVAASDQERELIIEGLLTVEVDVSRLRGAGDDGCDIGGLHRETILESPHSADLIDGVAPAARS